MGVDLVLGGHVHHLNVTTSRALLPESGRAGIPLVASGTTTSRRGRGPEAGRNSLNVVRVGTREIEVVPHFLEPGEEAFLPATPILLERPRLHEAEAGAGEARS